MTRRSFAFLVFASALLMAQNRIPDWIRQANNDWYGALNTGNAPALAKLYALDAVSISPSRVLRGRRQIERFHKGNFEKQQTNCSWELHGAQVLEKQAAVWGTDKCTETPRSGAKPWTSATRWLTVYEKQPDGSWLVVRESYDLIQ